MRETTKTKITFIRDWAKQEGSITTWHWNDKFLEWWKTFYNDKSGYVARHALCQYAKQLVESGFLNKSVRSGLGWGGNSEFGVNFQTSWSIKDTSK